jgi:oxygen-dependent protoporphyrinogen oxidase
MKRVMVIGGGIAGLSAAYALLKQARQQRRALEISVLERERAWGGKITTVRVSPDGVRGGFVIEGGPDTFLATKPWGVALCKELGLGERLHGTNPQQRSTYVLQGGRLQSLPDGLTMMIPTQIRPMLATGLLSWPAKLRMGADFFIPPLPLNGDESLGAFVTRRLGRDVYERLIEPLMSGIYAGDGDQLSLQATFPYLRDLELQHGGLVRGALATRRKLARQGKASSAPGSRSAFLTPTTGLAEIVEALVGRLREGGVELRSGSSAMSVQTAGSGFAVVLENGERKLVDGLVLAAPAFASAALLAEVDAALAAELKAIEYVSTATVSLAYPQEDLRRPLDGYGYVIPRREGRQALACTWTSTKFPHRAPQGYALLRVFIGRAGQQADLPWSEAGLLQLARNEVAETLGLRAEPALSRVFMWKDAMPQYNLGHPARLRRIEAALQAWPGLALAGNGYHGIGIPDCIRSGELASEVVLRAM